MFDKLFIIIDTPIQIIERYPLIMTMNTVHLFRRKFHGPKAIYRIAEVCIMPRVGGSRNKEGKGDRIRKG